MFEEKQKEVEKKSLDSQEKVDSLISKEIKPEEMKEEKKKKEDIEIHVMPEKFLPKQSGKKMSSKKKIIISIISFILFLIISLGVMLYIASSSIKKQQNINNKNVNVEEEVIEEEDNEEIIEEEDNEEIIEEEEDNEEIIEEEEIVTNIDTDQDNLTLLEENIYNTNKNKKDTDGDGYNDGQEIVNLYNPLASKQKLLNSGLISVYRNIVYKYNIFKPVPWIAQFINESNNEIIFLNNAETGEFIIIKVVDNEGLNLNTFANSILQEEVVLENYNLGDKPALRTSDGLNVFMITEDYGYHIEYNLGELEIVNFATTLEMMLNSFVILENE